MIPRLLLAIGAGAAIAQAPPTQNQDSWSFRNQKATYGMTVGGGQAGAGALVSGTKVEMGFFANVRDTMTIPSDGLPRYSDARIVKLKVTCSDASPALDFERAYAKPPPDTDPEMESESPAMAVEAAPDDPVPEGVLYVEGSQAVRIASTEVPDGSTIRFTIVCTARFFNGDGMGGELASPAPHQETHTIVGTVTACNKVLLLATQEVFQGNGYTIDPTDPLTVTAKNVVDSARPKFAGGLHHTLVPVDDTAETTWRKTASPLAIQGNLNAVTALFWCTHGEPTNLRASLIDSMVFSPYAVTSELRGLAYTGRAIPDLNIAIIYSCKAVGNSGLGIALKLIGDNPDFIIPNRTVAGFTDVLHRTLAEPSGAPLEYHSDLIMQRLASGDPIYLARKNVEDIGIGGAKYVPKNTSGVAMHMSFPGDPNTRLRFVYLNTQEWSATPANERYQWFRIF